MTTENPSRGIRVLGLNESRKSPDMEGNHTDGIRRPGRYLTQLKARYFLNEARDNWKECTIINISLKGMGIEFNEAINVESTIHLMIIELRGSEPVTTKGKLRWLKQRENDFIGGIELAETLDEITFAMLI